MLVPAAVVKRLERNRASDRGMDVKIAKPNIRRQVGGGLLSSILALGKTFGPKALAGAGFEGASQVVKKVSWWRDPIVPRKNIDKLAAYRQTLTALQKRDQLNSLQTGSDFTIRPTARQVGSDLGRILMFIGITMLV